LGAREAGVEIVAAFDLWPLAGEAHDANFPEAEFISGRLEEQDIDALVKRLDKIDLILASPECTNHSPAKGNKPRCEQSKDTAFQSRALCQSVHAPMGCHRERGQYAEMDALR